MSSTYKYNCIHTHAHSNIEIEAIAVAAYSLSRPFPLLLLIFHFCLCVMPSMRCEYATQLRTIAYKKFYIHTYMLKILSLHATTPSMLRSIYFMKYICIVAVGIDREKKMSISPPQTAIARQRCHLPFCLSFESLPNNIKLLHLLQHT